MGKYRRINLRFNIMLKCTSTLHVVYEIYTNDVILIFFDNYKYMFRSEKANLDLSFSIKLLHK